MEEGKIQEVMDKLRKEQEIAPNHQGLKACIRYIKNRPGQFHYPEAKAKELPLGSGKVQSTHKSLIQRRLKTSGAWWLKENANAMPNLRTFAWKLSRFDDRKRIL